MSLGFKLIGIEKRRGNGKKWLKKNLANLYFQGYGTILPSTSRHAKCNLVEARGGSDSVTPVIWILEIKALSEMAMNYLKSQQYPGKF